jgi:hypothetical protein
VEPRSSSWNSSGVLAILVQEGTRRWEDIPGVVIVGILMGLGFLIVAIRVILGKKK